MGGIATSSLHPEINSEQVVMTLLLIVILKAISEANHCRYFVHIPIALKSKRLRLKAFDVYKKNSTDYRPGICRIIEFPHFYHLLVYKIERHLSRLKFKVEN